MDENPITFETLPQAMSYLIERVKYLETLITKKLQQEPSEVQDRWLNTKELREYLSDHPAESTVYGWVAARAIPYHKTGKKLQFLKSEIDAWIKGTRQKTEAELQEEAINYVNERRIRK